MVAKEPLPPEVKEAIERITLLNAVRHGGKAEVGAVMGRILGDFPNLRTAPGQAGDEVKSAVRRVNEMPQKEQEELLQARAPGMEKPAEKEGRVGLPQLPNAITGKTAFRLPPEPSGFMHIGHAMAFNINYLYKEMYDGQLWLRFEDTNPKKAERQYYDNFRRGIAWLGIKFDHEKNVSDDMELMYEHGRKLIKDGSAYACSCDQDRVKKLRFDGEECEHRSLTTEESLRIWDEMLARKHREGSYVVRLKGDMKNLDYSLRDPNMFRVIEHPHPLTGDKYILWPTYNLANAIEDELCGITHVLRSSEFHTALQDLIRKKLGLRHVEVVQFSRFNFKGTPVQKRLLRPLVEQGLVSGWDDPRMPTVEGVRRRGILPEALRQFTLQVGYTKTEHEYDWSLLYAVNRRLLDPISKRLYFVPDPVGIEVKGAPARSVTMLFHPEKDLGDRTVQTGDRFFVPRKDLELIKKGESFRLMELFNAELKGSGDRPTAVYTGDELIPGIRKVQWVTEDHIDVRVMVTGPLFDEKGEFDKASVQGVKGLAEPAFSELKEGEIVQFPRFGFCRLDAPGIMIMAHK